jgi:hypothetical protein
MNQSDFAAGKDSKPLPEVYIGQQWKWRQDTETQIVVVSGNDIDGWKTKRIDKNAFRPKHLFHTTTSKLVKSYEPL